MTKAASPRFVASYSCIFEVYLIHDRDIYFYSSIIEFTLAWPGWPKDALRG